MLGLVELTRFLIDPTGMDFASGVLLSGVMRVYGLIVACGVRGAEACTRLSFGGRRVHRSDLRIFARQLSCSRKEWIKA
eukprot:scaffold7115_cov125-Isochrysis_galbana.AAC.12